MQCQELRQGLITGAIKSNLRKYKFIYHTSVRPTFQFTMTAPKQSTPNVYGPQDLRKGVTFPRKASARILECVFSIYTSILERNFVVPRSLDREAGVVQFYWLHFRTARKYHALSNPEDHKLLTLTAHGWWHEKCPLYANARKHVFVLNIGVTKVCVQHSMFNKVCVIFNR